jgi:hypothetical protein
MSWKKGAHEIGNPRVTRLFYRQLPNSFSRQRVPEGVLLIVSYKQPTTNVASYVRSIPADEDVQLVFHHEAEADYASGSAFVSQFNAQEQLAHSANPRIPFAFVGGGFGYRQGQPGYDGSFIPPKADAYYLDSYQRGDGWSPLRPAEQDPTVQRFRSLLAAKGHQFNGFTEYGRGAVDRSHPLTRDLVHQRMHVFAADEKYLRSLPNVQVWAYWDTTDRASGTQWRLTDSKSQSAWRAIVNR